MSIKYSIVIPTWNKCKELLIPCIESIIKNTSLEKLSQIELVVVANGCTDETVEYIKSVTSFGSVNLVQYQNPIGYTKAANAGIRSSSGEKTILMNNDCVILSYERKDFWIDELERPFKTEDKVGITGVKKVFSKEIQDFFLIFFLVMIKNEVFDSIGILDEEFNPGGGEDIDFCKRAKEFGFAVVSVPDDNNSSYETTYPIYHAAEKTVFDVPGWEEKFWARMRVLEERRDSYQYAKYADVTAYVSTKGRYLTSLPACLISIANQTKRPQKMILFQDDYNDFDLRESQTYRNIFKLFEKKGIGWEVIFGEGKGQVLNHQKALHMAKTEWVWRLDDDNVAESDVLERLCQHIKPNVGAIAGSVVEPGFSSDFKRGENKIEEIDHTLNYQWIIGGDVIEAEHLYSSFMYRKTAAAHGYCTELSSVGHREETIFSHEIFRKGWKLIVDPSVVTWHMRESFGGIRSFSDASLWEIDEKIFRSKLSLWRVQSDSILINMDSGIGDHWIFKPVLKKIIEKNPDKKILLAACYGEVFEDLENLEYITIADAKRIFGESFEKLNVYRYCMSHDWKNRPLEEAFEEIYLK